MTPLRTPPTTFAVVGLHGFGSHHLAELAELSAAGRARVVAVADPRGADGVTNLPPEVPCYPDLVALLAQVVPDVVVIATPIHTHLPLAVTAMRAGAHVLLEKPTAATLSELTELVDVAEQTDRAVQIGFQSFGSHALPRIAALIAEGAIGEVQFFSGLGTWQRTVAYYERSRWAGRRELDGVPVVDGVVTNPLAHSVATALRIAGCLYSDDVADVDTELYRAHDIQADDTSSVRVRTTAGQSLTFGLTLCADGHTAPTVTVHGSGGELVLEYTNDVLHVRRAGHEAREERFGRTSLKTNLIDHIADRSVPLLAPAAETGSFMRVLEGVRTAPDPSPIDDAYVAWAGEGSAAHPLVLDVAEWCARAGREQKLFSELGAPWAAPQR